MSRDDRVALDDCSLDWLEERFARLQQARERLSPLDRVRADSVLRDLYQAICRRARRGAHL